MAAKKNIRHNYMISDLTLSMCGPQRNATNSVENPHPGTNMKLKAADNGLILLWVVDDLERLGGSVPFCEDLCAAGHCFCAYLDCIRSQPEIIPLVCAATHVRPDAECHFALPRGKD